MYKPFLILFSIFTLNTACDSHDEEATAAVTALTGDEANGEVLYDANCAACHGASAEGASGPAIFNEEAENFVEAIQNGEGSMPAFPDLSDQDIADIIAFVGTL